MDSSLKLFGIVEYLLNFLMNFDFLELIVEEYKLLEVKLLGLSFVVPKSNRQLCYQRLRLRKRSFQFGVELLLPW